jgi:hypothetical protein
MKYLAAFLFVGFFAGQISAQEPARITGDYVEARSGHVYTCGCLYSGEMVTGGKEAIIVWRVGSGDFKGISLAGVKVAAVVVGESNLGADDKPRQTAIYLDGVTSDGQKQAILDLWTREYSSALGEITSVRAVPISFERQGEILNVNIPDIAQLEVRKALLPQDAHLGSTLWYGPFAPLRDSTLATALHYEYWGNEFQRQWRELLPSISGYFGRFTLTAGL